MVPGDYTLSDFDFALPPELIAQVPPPERTGSRLLHVSGNVLTDRRFQDLPQLLRAGDLLVLNDTRVVKSRLAGTKSTGGKVELLLERLLGADEALFQIRASHAPRPGQSIRLPGDVEATVLERSDRFFRLRLAGVASLPDYLDRHGAVPLPPYIARDATGDDETRYQTVYSRHPGAVAAPTAGLHFDLPLLAALRDAGVELAWVTLHVGAGTFQPVQTEDIAAHRMHAERYRIPADTVAAVARARARGGRVTAVGTTSLRALEAAGGSDGVLRAGEAETALFIRPGYRFAVVDRLLTNFHLPRSTLLMLVSALGGCASVRAAYRHAIAQRYRFFSYGDAMLVERDPS
ncbi:MAG: tRNA preQ1(34) S-adenosylmethionine ribosyltransferase-isomerase QueA [Betaproteobacteria bacterium]|jgi:S-adenosylmethionine:tRNA ribosyltransferase-isomerase|nr:tRNA preQ1(34) S-adenosylmethionine ribosyltransferase-isomerase QueA [Betaproteobacteria bacterium]MBK9675901.1 tRNA preQ1(34) S-adenosylmethionine ribosyltransferase-isomerase QueA [Betaproteobacteria bacterium]